ncbi:hypothetical protein ILUMI_10415, partial [Ignelater luminosus]
MEKLTENKYFKKEVIVLKAFGLSIEGNESISYRIYSCVCIFGVLFTYSVIDTLELFKVDANELTSIVIYQTAFCLAFCKSIIVLRNRTQFAKIMNKLQHKPFLPDPERGGKVEEKLIQECVWITNVQTSTYWILGGCSILAAVFYTLYERITHSDYHYWQLPYGPLTLINITYSPNFEIVWCYQSISMWLVGVIYTSTDALVAAILAHACYQFKILQNCIRNYGETDDEKMKEGNATDHSYSLHVTLKNIVEYHVAIFDIVEEMEIIFNQLLLIQFTGTLCVLCISIYQTTEVRLEY